MPPPSGDGDDGDDYDEGDDKDNIDDGGEKERKDILSFIRYLQRIIQWMAEYCVFAKIISDNLQTT